MEPISWIAAVLAAVADVALLRPAVAYERLATTSLTSVAIGVAMLAGASTMLGHVVVFLLNHIHGLRLFAGVALGGLYLSILHLISAGVVGLTVIAVVGDVTPMTIAVAYLFAISPRVLGFLVFLPHIGLGIGRVLEGWWLIALVVLLAQVLDLGRWHALLVAGIAWLLTQLLSRLLARPVASLTSRAWTRLSGRTTFITAHDILAGAPFVPLERTKVEVTS